jgi:outer membrane protein
MKMHCAAVLLASLAPLCAQAQESEPPGQWRIGVGVAIQDTLYAGQDSRVLPFPLIDYEGERFYWKGLDIGYQLIERDGFKLNGFVGARLDGMDASDLGAQALLRNGVDRDLLEDRDNAVNAGMSAIWTGPAGEFALSAETDITGASGGYRGAFEYRASFQVGAVRLIPSVGIKLLSRDYADYYYGTLPEEVARGVIDYRPGRSTVPHAGIAAVVPINARWASVLAVELERYPSDITDSPLIEPDTKLVPTVFVGISRSF